MDAGCADEFNLLGLLVVNGRGALQGIEVEFVEGLFLHDLLCPLVGHTHGGSGGHVHGYWRGHELVHIARHQLDLRVFERLTALILHGDPSDQIDEVGLVRAIGDDQVVVCVPIHTATHVGKFGVEGAGLVGLEQPA